VSRVLVASRADTPGPVRSAGNGGGIRVRAPAQILACFDVAYLEPRFPEHESRLLD